MAAIKYVDLTRLTQYDGLIKNYINTADAKAYKTVAFDSTTKVLSFYKTDAVDASTVADFTVTIPETDVSDLLAKLTGAVEGDVVVANADGTVKDSGVKLEDLATDAELKTVSDVSDANKTAIETLNGDETTAGSVAKTVKDAVDTVDAKVGTLADLETTAKTDLVVAINEVRDAVSAGGTDAAVTMTTDTTTAGMLKSYTIKQGQNTVGTIDIPKDLFPVSGQVVTNPDGQTPGTYVEIVIENQEDPIYIDVASLIDNYKAQENATQIQLSVDNDTREISATIVAGGVTATELAENAVTTTKIANANVTLAKLATDVTTAFDSAGSASAAESNAKTYADNLNTAMNTRVEALETAVGDGFEAVTEADITALFA